MTLTSSSPSPSNRVISPTAIAVLSSLGVHGLIFALIPLLPDPADVLQTPPEPVAVVDLSPSEQQRLPNLDRPPLPAFPGNGSELYQFDDPPSNGSLFPDISTLPGAPSSPPQFRSRTIVPSTPSYPSYPSYPSRSSSRSPLFTQPSPSRLPSSRPSTQIPTPTTPRSQPNPSNPLNGTIGLSNDIPELQGLDLARRPEAGATPSPAPNTSPTTEPNPDQDPNAANPDPTPAPANDAVADRLRAEVAEIRRLYSYNGTNTEPGAIAKNSDDWLNAARENLEAPDLVFAEKAPIDLEIPYDRRACLSENPGNASVLVVLNGAQELVADPEVVGSTGYLGLDEAAAAAVNEYDFSALELPPADPAQEYTALTFRVAIAYDPEDCLSAEPPASAS